MPIPNNLDKKIEKEFDKNDRSLLDNLKINGEPDLVKLYFESNKNVRLLTAQEEVNLSKRSLKGDIQARNTLVVHNQKFVYVIAKNYRNKGLDFLDLIAEGNIGLIRAAERFDYKKGSKFSSYAGWWIKQGITNALATYSRTIRFPVDVHFSINKLEYVGAKLFQKLKRDPTFEELSNHTNFSVEQIRAVKHAQSKQPHSLEYLNSVEQEVSCVVPAPGPSVQNKVIQKNLQEIIASGLDKLTIREKTVIERRFGLNERPCETLVSIGNSFGVTRERIRQIEIKALSKLKQNYFLKKKLRIFYDN